MKSRLFFLMLIALTKIGYCQTIEEFNELALNKEWKLEMYEEEGEKFPPAPENKNDKMIFKSDHTVVSIEREKTDKGKWSYDENSKILIITDSNSGQKIILKVLKLTNEIFKTEFKDPDGISLIMYMKS